MGKPPVMEPEGGVCVLTMSLRTGDAFEIMALWTGNSQLPSDVRIIFASQSALSSQGRSSGLRVCEVEIGSFVGGG